MYEKQQRERTATAPDDKWPIRPQSDGAFFEVLLRRRLSPGEKQHRAEHYGGHSEDRRHQAAFLRGYLQRANLDFVPALRIRYSAHRDDDNARDDEKYANPAKWPHDFSGVICGPAFCKLFGGVCPHPLPSAS